MDLDDINELIDQYGVERILEDHRLSWALVLQILDECRYIDLEDYSEGNTDE